MGRIAYQTGFFGESAAQYFPAQRLFELLWIRPYFAQANAFGFMAVLDGQAVGYVLGSTSQLLYRRAMTHSVLRTVWSVLPPVGKLWLCLRYLLRLARFAPPHADWTQYPAHLHINLLPDARGFRLGEQLLEAYLLALSERAVPGVQLSTTTENQAAVGLYHKFGFQVLVSKVTPLWTPWLGHPAQHLIMGRLESAISVGH